MKPLHDRIAATEPQLPAQSAGDYFERYIRRRVYQAFQEERLAVGLYEISQHVRMVKSQDALEVTVAGGRKNFQRCEELVDLRMLDGGWICFAATLRMSSEGLKIVAYNFERVFGSDAVPPWVRFDLNLPGHENEATGLRSHMHPGNDDVQLPAPIFAPHELLDTLLTTLGPREGRSPRTDVFVQRS